MCCTRLAEIQDAKVHQKFAICAPSGYIFAIKHVSIDNRKKLVKQQYLLHTPHNMEHVGPLAADIGWRVWVTPGKFQRVSRLRFVTAPTSVNEDQPNFARCLPVSWAGTL